MANNVVPFQPTNAEMYRASTDAADLCRAIVLATAVEIQGRKYVRVEGWQAIAVAHGCVGSACDVEVVEGGYRARGQVRRMSDGMVISEGEGFVGKDEPVWFGGTLRKWKWGRERGEKVWYDEEMPKRLDYAIRAMAQTRAISRACRAAFAHVVVLIDKNLSTTPAEEVPFEGFDDAIQNTPAPERARQGRQEPAQPAAPVGRAPGAPRTEARPEPPRRADAPAPQRTIERQGVIPAPEGQDVGQWTRWQRAVARRIETAKTEQQVLEVQQLHADAVARSAKVIEGSATAFAELVMGRIHDLKARAA